MLESACRVQAESAGRAISSAVEHLPYKQIVTGSIPVSPIFKTQISQTFQLLGLRINGFVLVGDLALVLTIREQIPGP